MDVGTSGLQHALLSAWGTKRRCRQDLNRAHLYGNSGFLPHEGDRARFEEHVFEETKVADREAPLPATTTMVHFPTVAFGAG